MDLVALVTAISTTLGARNGLLVRDRAGLEEARLLNAVVFDKTGTLTLGEHPVVAMRAAARFEESEALRLAAGIERMLAPNGLVLSPAIGAVLMSLSTVIVAINAQLLRRAEI
jgi:cation transport ATPase